jgi:hypothetical protein
MVMPCGRFTVIRSDLVWPAGTEMVRDEGARENETLDDAASAGAVVPRPTSPSTAAVAAAMAGRKCLSVLMMSFRDFIGPSSTVSTMKNGSSRLCR